MVPALPPRPVIATPGHPPVAARGSSLVIREWTMSGPSYLHVHHNDDEAWHVLEGSLQFVFADGEIEAPAGTTVFVPAGVAHTYRASQGSRYLIILTPKIDRLIEHLLHPAQPDDVRPTLHAFDTDVVEDVPSQPDVLDHTITAQGGSAGRGPSPGLRRNWS